MLPDFIIGGTQKAGTTSLFRYLSDHPSICASSKKEVDLFVKQLDTKNAISLKTYSDFFSHCSNLDLVRLEASPSYLMNAEKIAKNIYKNLPKVKFIFILREPISVLFSYIKWKSVFKADLSIDRFIEVIKTRKKNGAKSMDQGEYSGTLTRLYAGCYADLLREYLNFYSSDQIGIFFFDDLSRHTHSFIRKVCTFMNIEDRFYRSYNFSIENKTRSYRFPVFHRAISKINLRLESLFNRYPYLRRNLRVVYHKYFETSERKLSIPTIETNILKEFYLPHNIKLSKFLKSEYPDLSLPQWLCED